MIRIRQLNKQYGSNSVLRGVDLDVAPGEFLVVLGQSGAGKSTLLRCINRLVDADAGELSIDGIDVRQTRDVRALRRQIGMIFQHHHVVPRLSVIKNVLTGRLGSCPTLASLFQLFRQTDLSLALDCLRRVDLTDKAEARTDSLSGGQMQRVGIARALAQQPRVILADEPVASLDPQSARLVLQYLRAASRELGIAVVCNLHQVEYAREFSDRIVGLAHGRVVFNGSGEQLGEADLRRIYPGQPAEEEAREHQAVRMPSPHYAVEMGE